MTPEQLTTLNELNRNREEFQNRLDEIDNAISEIYYEDAKANPRPKSQIEKTIAQIYGPKIEQQLRNDFIFNGNDTSRLPGNLITFNVPKGIE